MRQSIMTCWRTGFCRRHVWQSAVSQLFEVGWMGEVLSETRVAKCRCPCRSGLASEEWPVDEGWLEMKSQLNQGWRRQVAVDNMRCVTVPQTTTFLSSLLSALSSLLSPLSPLSPSCLLPRSWNLVRLCSRQLVPAGPGLVL